MSQKKSTNAVRPTPKSKGLPLALFALPLLFLQPFLLLRGLLVGQKKKKKKKKSTNGCSFPLSLGACSSLSSVKIPHSLAPLPEMTMSTGATRKIKNCCQKIDQGLCRWGDVNVVV